MEVTVRKSALGRRSRFNPSSALFAIGADSPRLASACMEVNLPMTPVPALPLNTKFPSVSAPALTTSRLASVLTGMESSPASSCRFACRVR